MLRKISENVLPLALLAASSCHPGAIAKNVRPEDPTAAQSMGEDVCRDSGSQNDPLVVDWEDYQRDGLEIAMKKGVAVVSYDCHSLRLLPDCHLEGNYEFEPTSKQEKTIVLRNADEVRTNLPTSGQVLGNALEAGMSRGDTLDITLSTIGRVVTTRSGVSRELLRGDCEDATHIVRAATIGAFKMQTNTRGAVNGSGQVMRAGGSFSGSSEKTVNLSSGDMQACSKETTDNTPPKECSTPVRLHLEAVEESDREYSEVGKPKGGGNTDNSGIFVQPDVTYSYMHIPGTTTDPSVLRFGANGGVTFGFAPLTLTLGGGAMWLPNGGQAPHYTWHDEGTDRWTAYTEAGVGYRPRWDWIGVYSMASAFGTYKGGRGFDVEAGPEFYFSPSNSLAVTLGGGYMDWGSATGGSPYTTLPDPNVDGGTVGLSAKWNLGL